MKTLLEKSLNNDSVTGKGAACLGDPTETYPAGARGTGEKRHRLLG